MSAGKNIDALLSSFSDPALCRSLLHTLEKKLSSPLRFMEVCGTHTVSIFRSGLRSLLPEGITHLSGPGCPVCVTHDREIAACLQLAATPGVIIATFGDMLRVPGPGGSSLKEAQAAGGRVEVVYSPLDALELARRSPESQVVFLGVGFETTAPAVAAAVRMAGSSGLKNFKVLSFHKLVPPALRLLLSGAEGAVADAGPDAGIDAFLLPGHVSTILGLEPYRFIAEEFGKPGVIGGFDPADILQSLLIMLETRENGRGASIVNQYRRAVDDNGNPKARRILFDVFSPQDALWRGLGVIPQSGLVLKEEYAAFDAWKHFGLVLPDVPEIKGCQCGKILKGQAQPDACPLFGKACTPAKPVGPCMVSTEGSCAAYFKYGI